MSVCNQVILSYTKFNMPLPCYSPIIIESEEFDRSVSPIIVELEESDSSERSEVSEGSDGSVWSDGFGRSNMSNMSDRSEDSDESVEQILSLNDTVGLSKKYKGSITIYFHEMINIGYWEFDNADGWDFADLVMVEELKGNILMNIR